MYPFLRSISSPITFIKTMLKKKTTGKADKIFKMTENSLA